MAQRPAAVLRPLLQYPLSSGVCRPKKYSWSLLQNFYTPRVPPSLFDTVRACEPNYSSTVLYFCVPPTLRHRCTSCIRLLYAVSDHRSATLAYMRFVPPPFWAQLYVVCATSTSALYIMSVFLYLQPRPILHSHIFPRCADLLVAQALRYYTKFRQLESDPLLHFPCGSLHPTLVEGRPRSPSSMSVIFLHATVTSVF